MDYQRQVHRLFSGVILLTIVVFLGLPVALADGPTLPSRVYWQPAAEPAAPQSPAGTNSGKYLQRQDIAPGLIYLRADESWSASQYGGPRKFFSLIDASYRELYGFKEVSCVQPHFYGEPHWLVRAADDRDVMPNCIRVTQEIASRIMSLPNGYKWDRADNLAQLAKDDGKRGQVVQIGQLGFGPAVKGYLLAEPVKQGSIRYSANVISGHDYMTVEAFTQTIPAHAASCSGRDSQWTHVDDKTTFTFEQFKALVSTALRKLGAGVPLAHEAAKGSSLQEKILAKQVEVSRQQKEVADWDSQFNQWNTQSAFSHAGLDPTKKYVLNMNAQRKMMAGQEDDYTGNAAACLARKKQAEVRLKQLLSELAVLQSQVPPQSKPVYQQAPAARFPQPVTRYSPPQRNQ